MNKREKAACAACILIGVILPWALIVSGGLISIFATDGYWGETAAYLAAVGVVLLAMSALFGAAVNHFIDQSRMR